MLRVLLYSSDHGWLGVSLTGRGDLAGLAGVVVDHLAARSSPAATALTKFAWRNRKGKGAELGQALSALTIGTCAAF